jgi:hypothetical protein
MTRTFENRVWLLLLAAAVAVVVACSSSSTTGTGTADSAVEDAPAASTKG